MAGGARGEAARLERAILAALRAAGRDAARIGPEDLAPLDALHLGGAAASERLLALLPPCLGEAVLDIGAGGTARLLASRHGAAVTGIDRDPVMVALARRLTARTGLAGRCRFLQGEATALPFPGGRFDLVLLVHLAMAVAERDRLLAEARRVLRPGGLLLVYDVVRAPGAAPPRYPTPWAERAEASFLLSAAETRDRLVRAGLGILAELELSELARERLARLRARLAAADPAAVPGPHLLMGAEAAAKLANLAEALEAGRIGALALLARRP